MPVVWLVGMMGAGKTTVGRLVAERNGVEHRDLDGLIEVDTGRRVADIFLADGETGFRAVESAALLSLSGDLVVSTGGGAVLDPLNVDHMRRTGVVVHLEASLRVLAERLGRGSRPLLSPDPAQRLPALLEERRPVYESAAHYIVDADQPIEAVADLVAGCGRFDAGESSAVFVGPGLPRLLLPHRAQRQQAVVISQPGSRHVARAVLGRLGHEVDTIAAVELPDREAAKSIESIAAVYDQLADLNVGRHDTIVGVGGGTVTDVAGFVAATWLRGVESVMIPTTLLGAVDAAIGGKTGINVRGKNLVGAFWHPTRISVSLEVMDALDEQLRREGAAEAIKVGFIADPTIVDLYRTHGLAAPSGQVVRRAVAVKAEIVADDYRELGRRMLLNFGHTIGHGLEAHLGIAHGHAVAIGMVAAAAISQHRLGFDADLVIEPLLRLGLPIEAPGADSAAVMDLVGRDKKRTAEGIRMVLLADIASPVVEQVDGDDLARGLAAIGMASPAG